MLPSLRRIFVSLLVFTGCLVSAAPLTSGQPAPDFTFTDLSGKAGKLSDFRGKIVILEWLNPGCPYVLRHYKSGNLPALQKSSAAEGVIWLQINSNAMGDLDPKASVEWQKKYGALATAYIRDQTGQLGRLYGARTTPHLFVIGRNGTLAYQGAIDDQPSASLATTSSAHNYVAAALAALKAGRPVEKTTTEPYGCAVKFERAP